MCVCVGGGGGGASAPVSPGSEGDFTKELRYLGS